MNVNSKETAAMTQHRHRQQAYVGASAHSIVRTVVALAALMCLCAGIDAEAQYNSGSSGTHGVFPPPQTDGTVPPTTNIVWNMRTGGVRYCSSYTFGTGSDQCDAGGGTNVFVQIPNIPAGGLTTGIYEFTDVNISTVSGVNRRLIVVGTSPNVALTILSQNDINVSGTASGNSTQIFLSGQTPPSANSNFAEAGARSGPGGFDGGASGNGGAIPGSGSAGFGPVGGAAGRADAVTAADLSAASAGAPPLNPSLTPLVGGSGGGGGAGLGPTNTFGCTTNTLGYGGGPGGGGGGAILLAASNRVTLGQFASLLANGGNGGRGNNGSAACAAYGGGGGGGSVRIVAHEFVGTGTINISGGTRSDNTNPSFGGHVRIEAALNTYSGTITGASGGSFLSFPTASVPNNQPVLRIVSIAGTAMPANPVASIVTPDVTFASAIEAPVTLTVGASNVPLGTTVNIRVVPAVGQPTTAISNGLSGTLASSTANASVSLPPGAGIVTASATFTIGGSGGDGGGGAAFNALPLIDGKKPERIEVAALADGTSRAYLVSQSGVRFELGTSRAARINP
jgi:hypothetical protein